MTSDCNWNNDSIDARVAMQCCVLELSIIGFTLQDMSSHICTQAFLGVFSLALSLTMWRLFRFKLLGGVRCAGAMLNHQDVTLSCALAMM